LVPGYPTQRDATSYASQDYDPVPMA